ncbi:hypothetical protein D3C72_1407890 [compost metagenome]
MKKSFIALAFIISHQSALAATLECTLNGDDGKDSVTITENVPQVGLATLTWSQGDSSVVTFSEKITTGGCLEFTEKTYFHPYYTLNISAKKGMKQTRCAGMISGYSGFFSGEMQPPKRLTCKGPVFKGAHF